MAQRRIGKEKSETRSVLLDATERLMVEESFASVTSRRVAALSGVQPALVHYYFPTLDDLFVAVYRRRSDRLVERINTALEDEQPLWAIWEFNSDKTATGLVTEFMALTNHRTAIREVVLENAELVRKLQVDGITEALARHDADTGTLTPPAMMLLMIGLTRAIVVEESLGLTTGHGETLVLVEQYLEQIEGPRRRPKPPKKQAAAKVAKTKSPTTKSTAAKRAPARFPSAKRSSPAKAT